MNRSLMNPSKQPLEDIERRIQSYSRNFGRELAFVFGAIAILVVVPKVQEDANFGRLLISPIDANTNPSTIDKQVEKFTSFTLEEPKRVIGVANAYFLANWYQKGIEYLEIVRKMDQRNWESRDALALAYSSLNEPEKAVQMREEMTSLDPNHWINLFELANLYVKLNRIDKATLYFKKVVLIAPNSEEGKKSTGWLEGAK